MYRVLIWLLIFQFKIIQILFKSKDGLILEAIELRQQLATYQAKKENSENITDLTGSLLVALKSTYPKWMDALIIVKPDPTPPQTESLKRGFCPEKCILRPFQTPVSDNIFCKNKNLSGPDPVKQPRYFTLDRAKYML